MRKTYTYENAIIHITIPDSSIKNIHKATERFLNKLIKEKNQNGNINTSGSFYKK